MSGPSDSLGGSDNEPPTAGERRNADLEAELTSARADLAAERRSAESLRQESDNRQEELDTERTNSEALQRAIGSLQIEQRRQRNEQDELLAVANRTSELLRQMLEASQVSNADLRRQLEERSAEVTRLETENRRLTQQVDELQGTEEGRIIDAVADATREAQAEISQLRNRQDHRAQQLQNSEQILKDVLEQHDNASPISITEAGIVRLFNSFVGGKHLTTDAHVNGQVDAFMRDFDVPADLVQPLRDRFRDAARRVRDDRHPARRGQQ